MIDPEIIRAVPAGLWTEIYTDGAKRAVQVFGSIGEDAVKTVRLALFPLQYAGQLQDRLARRLQRAAETVPLARRISPNESITLQIADRLRQEGENSEISHLYEQLLSRAMDSDRVNEAHPAFVNTIAQLSPDEALILDGIRVDHSYFLASNAYCIANFNYAVDDRYFSINIDRVLDSYADLSIGDREILRQHYVISDGLAHKDLILHLKHLEHLDLIELYPLSEINKELPDPILRQIHFNSSEWWQVFPTKFGQLFLDAIFKK